MQLAALPQLTLQFPYIRILTYFILYSLQHNFEQIKLTTFSHCAGIKSCGIQQKHHKLGNLLDFKLWNESITVVNIYMLHMFLPKDYEKGDQCK